MSRASNNSGFTLIEIMIVVVVSVPMLAAVLTTSKAVGGLVHTNERSADAVNKLEETINKIGRFIRPASLATVETKATTADVAIVNTQEQAKLAADVNYVIVVPTEGTWLKSTIEGAKQSVRMQAPESVLAYSKTAMTTHRELEFVMDSNETDNDLDDDGDGLIDEGKLYLTYNGRRFLLTDGVENFTFTVNGSAVVVSLTVARMDQKDRRVHRATLARSFYMHNK